MDKCILWWGFNRGEKGPVIDWYCVNVSRQMVSLNTANKQVATTSTIFQVESNELSVYKSIHSDVIDIMDSWYGCTTSNTNDSPRITPVYTLQKNQILFATCIQLKSQLYCIGGPNPCRQFLRYDHSRHGKNHKSCWKRLRSMGSERSNHCKVVSLGNRIYVMGGHDSTSYPDHFAEFYDFSTRQWSYLPAPPFKPLAYPYELLLCVAVEYRNMIYVSCPEFSHICAYNALRGEWEQLMYTDAIYCQKPFTLHRITYWLDGSSVYSVDLDINGSRRDCEIPEIKELYRKNENKLINPVLFHLDGQYFCIFWVSLSNKSAPKMQSNVLYIQISNSSTSRYALDVTVESCTSFTIDGYFSFHDAILLDGNLKDNFFGVSDAYERGSSSKLSKNGKAIELNSAPMLKEFKNINEWHNNFDGWLKSPKLKIWLYEKRECIGVDEDFRLVFRSIMAQLKTLHDADKYHGNLLEGLTIDGHEVNFVNFNDNMSCLESGKRKDMADFKTLLESVATAFPIIFQPSCFKLFIDILCVDYKKTRLIDDISYYFYNNPFFWDYNDSYKFIMVLWNLLNISPEFYNDAWLNPDLTKVHMYDMSGWICIPKEESVIYMMMNTSQYFDGISDFLRFARNVCVHYQENVNAQKQNEQKSAYTHWKEAAEDLFSTFPHGPSKLFYRVVATTFSADFEKYFGYPLVDYLKNVPFSIDLA